MEVDLDAQVKEMVEELSAKGDEDVEMVEEKHSEGEVVVVEATPVKEAEPVVE